MEVTNMVDFTFYTMNHSATHGYFEIHNLTTCNMTPDTYELLAHSLIPQLRPCSPFTFKDIHEDKVFTQKALFLEITIRTRIINILTKLQTGSSNEYIKTDLQNLINIFNNTKYHFVSFY